MARRPKTGRRRWLNLGVALLAVVTGCEQMPKAILATAEARWIENDALIFVAAFDFPFQKFYDIVDDPADRSGSELI